MAEFSFGTINTSQYVEEVTKTRKCFKLSIENGYFTSLDNWQVILRWSYGLSQHNYRWQVKFEYRIQNWIDFAGFLGTFILTMNRHFEPLPKMLLDTVLLFSISSIFALLFSLQVVTQIRGHIAGSSSSSPIRFVPCIIIAKIFRFFSPSSTRVELYLPTVGALRSFLHIFANKFKILPRRDSNSRINTSSVRR